jgi:hypothetical protein
MKRLTIFTAISLIFSLNAAAGETNQPLNRDLVVAVTEPGVGASDQSSNLWSERASAAGIEARNS